MGGGENGKLVGWCPPQIKANRAICRLLRHLQLALKNHSPLEGTSLKERIISYTVLVRSVSLEGVIRVLPPVSRVLATQPLISPTLGFPLFRRI